MPRPDARAVTAAVRDEGSGALDDLLFGAPSSAATPLREPHVPPPIETPADPPIETPANPPIETPANPPIETPANPPIETPATARRPRRALPAAGVDQPAAEAAAPVSHTLPSAGYGRSRFVQLTVPLPVEIHGALRDAAVARGSIREMSAIVREGIDRYLDHLEELDDQARAELLRRATDALDQARGRGRRDVAYRLEEEQRRRLLPFSGAQAIPMNALVAAAIAAVLPTE